MPSQVDEPEDHKFPEPTPADPYPDVDAAAEADGVENGSQTPLDHDELVALRSSRHVDRRPRRRRRWPWVTLLVGVGAIALAAATYLYAWPLAQELLVERDVSRAIAGYPTLVSDFSDGVATVSGEVPTQADIDVLLAALGGIDGVDDVQATLTTASPDGDPLESAIMEALADAGLATVIPIVDGSTVTLVGTAVDSDAVNNASSVVVAVDGVSQVLNRVVIASNPAAGAQALLVQAGFDTVNIDLEGDIAVLTGSVPAEVDIMNVATLVLDLPFIEKVDNRLIVGSVTTEESAPIAEEFDDVATALAASGYSNVMVTFDGETAALDGVVPFAALEDGYFAYVDDVSRIVREVGGATTVLNRLRLRGNEQELRSQLQLILDETPIVFLSGSSDLTIESQAALDVAAEVILSQPGLQILIAGHTDSSGSSEANELLARSRGGAVYGYLVSVGVPANRMVVVSYGELFPGEDSTAAGDRRIEFEVGP